MLHRPGSTRALRALALPFAMALVAGVPACSNNQVFRARDAAATRTDSGGIPNAPEDASIISGGGAYDDAGVSGAGDAACPSGDCNRASPNCASEETCNDGLDNDCDGTVDEDCACQPGTVQRCLLAPPGAVREGSLLGACSFGHQTCQGSGEFGIWGACEGGIGPRAETCDGLDNNCNGCADEGLCCSGNGTCPGPGDPRIPTGQPFSTLRIDGSSFATGDRYVWHVEGGPCDQLLFATTGHVSYKLNGTEGVDATGQNLSFAPTLSGDYTVHLQIYHGVELALDCTFIVPVRADGFRVEMCWDTTGTDDIDLWVHRPTNTNTWTEPDPFGLGTAGLSDNTCGWSTCRGGGLNWGYPDTVGGSCSGGGGRCANPRLDVDNISTEGIPENINIDNPRSFDTFRVAANYYGGDDHAVQPMINVYCGGELRATYGGADIGGRRFGAEPLRGFNRSGSDGSGSLWRVVDVTMNTTNDCTLHPLHPSGTRAGYCMSTNTDRTYAGGCSR